MNLHGTNYGSPYPPEGSGSGDAADRAQAPLGQSPAELRLARTVAKSELASPVMERAFLDALQGRRVEIAGRFQVYTHAEGDESVVLIHDPSGLNKHKYVIADIAGLAFIVAAPITWTPFHARIVDRIAAATGIAPICTGGGFVDVDAAGKLWVGGESGDFGAGDHARALAAFQRAVSRSSR